MTADENGIDPGHASPGPDSQRTNSDSPQTTSAVSELLGVYHADGGLIGELRYVVGKLRGTAHCALCDVTHGLTGKKQSFERCESAIPVPITLLHLNEREPDVLEASRTATPCVLARTERGLTILLGPAELEALGGRVKAFEAAISAAMHDASLVFAG